MTAKGGANVPMKFFFPNALIPFFTPTPESSWASVVVGIRTCRTPRWAVACRSGSAGEPGDAEVAGVAHVALAEADRPLYAFLLNHVLGEKLGQWGAAQQRLSLLLAAAGAAAPPVLWRQYAVAATLAGDRDAAAEAAAELARAAGVSLGPAQDLVRLAAAVFQVPACDAAAAAATTLQALLSLEAPQWQTASALDTPAAACCNNLAAHLSDRPTAQLQSPPPWLAQSKPMYLFLAPSVHAVLDH